MLILFISHVAIYIYNKFNLDYCILLVTNHSSNVFDTGSVILYVKEFTLILNDLFYNYIERLFNCFYINIMNIIYIN